MPLEAALQRQTAEHELAIKGIELDMHMCAAHCH